MSREAALRAALSLFRVPTQARLLRASPLPDGVTLLLKVAVREQDALTEAAALTARCADDLVDASGFFIEQILLHPDADSYRALGAEAASSTSELRSHMALLMRWLHPDVALSCDVDLPARAHLANRVLRAWDEVKTPERRSALDLRLSARRPNKHPRRPRITFRKQRPRRPLVTRLLSLLSGRPDS